MRYPNLRYGNPATLRHYLDYTGGDTHHLAKVLRRSERSVRDWATGRSKMPWWVPEYLRLVAFEGATLYSQARGELALAAIKSGNVGLAGPTGGVLDRSLVGLRGLIDRSLAEVRIGPGMILHRSVFSLANVIAQVKYSASLEAELLNCGLHVEQISSTLMVNADKDLLFSALGNLLQNAFKFSGKNGIVKLSVAAGADRLRIMVKDNGPGLSAEAARDMFLPFTQSGANKSGLGLGLSIARRSVEANDGLLTVESEPGQGCVFTIDLPRSGIATE